MIDVNARTQKDSKVFVRSAALPPFISSWSFRLALVNSGYVVTGFLSKLPDITLCSVAIVISLLLGRTNPSSILRGILLSAVCVLIGVAIASWRSQQVIDRQLPKALDREVIWLTGWIGDLADLPEENQDNFKISIYVNELSRSSCVNSSNLDLQSTYSVAGSIRLTWSSEFQDPDQAASQKQFFEHLKPADQFCIQAKLKRPRGLANPAGHDYQLWLLSEGYIATGYILDIYPYERRLARSLSQSIKITFNQLRYQLRQKLLPVLSEKRNLAAILALSIGDDHLLDDHDWQVLKQTGTLHLLVISGLHVGLIAALGFWLGQGIARIFGTFVGRYPLVIPVVCSVLCTLAYALLAGYSLPTQRAMIMVVVAGLLLVCGRIRQIWFGYWLSMLLVLINNPFAMHQIGFVLSFGVVFVILTTLLTQKHHSKLGLFVGLQTRIYFMMLIPLVLTTETFSLASWFSNLIAIPYVSLLLVPLTLISSCLAFLSPETVLFEWSIQLTNFAVTGFWMFLDTLASLNFTESFAFSGQLSGQSDGSFYVGLGAVPTLNWVFSLAIVVALLLPIWSFLHKLALIGSILIVLWFPAYESNPLKLVVFDVGQGFSALITTQTTTQTITDLDRGIEASDVHSFERHLYDTGPRFGESSSAIEAVLTPYLKFNRIDRIHNLVISHGDEDHSYLAEHLSEIASVSVDNTYVGEPHRYFLPAQSCQKGQSWRSGDVSFKILWPDESFIADKANDASCVLLVSYNDFTILFAGDISKSVEWKLEQAGLPKIDVLVAAHHGSNSSSSLRFLHALQPKHIVFSSGFGNFYRHPSEKVIQRIRQHLPNAQLWNTAVDGAIIITVDQSNQLLVNGYRKNHKRFWYELD